MNGIQQILNAMPWYAWIAVVVLAGGIVRQIVSMGHKHRERMEMIRQGMDPRDYPKKQDI